MLSKTLHSPFFTTILKRGFKMSATNNNKPTLRYLDEFPGRKTCTTGEYLARRLEQIGATSYFAVPGDFTLCLLDELLKIKNLRFVGCCNELNAGYAADGYSRVSKRLGVAVVTYCVGGLSLVNAVAGGFSDDLPMLIVSGGPNTNDAAQGHIIHHVSIIIIIFISISFIYIYEVITSYYKIIIIY